MRNWIWMMLMLWSGVVAADPSCRETLASQIHATPDIQKAARNLKAWGLTSSNVLYLDTTANPNKQTKIESHTDLPVILRESEDEKADPRLTIESADAKPVVIKLIVKPRQTHFAPGSDDPWDWMTRDREMKEREKRLRDIRLALQKGNLEVFFDHPNVSIRTSIEGRVSSELATLLRRPSSAYNLRIADAANLASRLGLFRAIAQTRADLALSESDLRLDYMQTFIVLDSENQLQIVLEPKLKINDNLDRWRTLTRVYQNWQQVIEIGRTANSIQTEEIQSTAEIYGRQSVSYFEVDTTAGLVRIEARVR